MTIKNLPIRFVAHMGTQNLYDLHVLWGNLPVICIEVKLLQKILITVII